MEEELKAFIDSKFQIPPIEGEDRTCSLREAIQNNIRPGQSIHIAGTGGALFYQLLREFWGKKPDFMLISPALTGWLLALIRGNMIRKATVTFAGNSYPVPGTNPHVQKAYISGAVKFENWSLLTLTQRLLAGAMGWEFIPTRSLAGSSMAENNREDFIEIDSPFGSGEKTGLLKALRPDITLVHGLAADRSGNTILPYPLGMDAYGAWASREGVIVSVEHLVPTDYIRSHSHLVRIPSYMVKAVCEVHYGAHPAGVSNCGLPQFEGYYDDYEFMAMLKDASMDESNFMSFIQEWVLNCHSHEQYMEKLGKDRLRYLRDKAKPHSWVLETLAAVPSIQFEKESNHLERMVIAGSRYIAGLCKEKGYKTVLAGSGLAALAAWLAVYRLRTDKIDVDLITESGMAGYLPRPSDVSALNMNNMPSCKMLTNTETALGVLGGGSAGNCLGVLSPAQVDRYGNGNSTKVPDVYYIAGSGSANDVASGCREVIVLALSGRERLLEKVPYITFPGDKVTMLVTDVGVFGKPDGRGAFMLTGFIPYGTAIREDEAIRGVSRLVEWEIEAAPHLDRVELPSYEEKTLLRLLDPQGFYTRAQEV